MPEELGKIEKPPKDDYRTGRKLYFVPLVFIPRDPPADLLEMTKNYWKEAETHVSNLEAKLGKVNKVYHELIPAGGEDGIKAMEELNSESYRLVRHCLDNGAELQPIEDADVLTEFMDWSKCVVTGLQNQKVFDKVYGYYTEAAKKRNALISQRIDETLKEDQVGILLMREGHQVQFASGIHVFYVSPPSLDEIKRWLRSQESRERDTTD